MRENISLVKEHLLLITEKRIMFAYKTHHFFFFTHSPVTGCLGCFMSLAVVNRVAESFDAQDSE